MGLEKKLPENVEFSDFLPYFGLERYATRTEEIRRGDYQFYEKTQREKTSFMDRVVDARSNYQKLLGLNVAIGAFAGSAMIALYATYFS